ncbi:MAG: enoyl-ACP reductase FabI [Myxococcota bacterium]
MKDLTQGLLEGRAGVILGLSGRNGLGYHSARQFREQGANVALTYRPERREALRPILDELGATGLELDATDDSSVERAMTTAGERFGRIDFLVHTLVHVPEGALSRSVLELSLDDMTSAMNVGVRSLLGACRYALPWLERSDAPRVVTLLSAGAQFALPHYHLAGIVKGALLSGLRYLAAELGPRGVLCNAVNFSILETDAAERVIGPERVSESRRHITKRSMTRRALEFEDVTRTIAFFASPWCRNVTAEVLNVDGGFSSSYF